MKLTIDPFILEKYNMSIEEFMILYLNSKNEDIKLYIDNVVAKGFADKSVFSDTKVILSSQTKELLDTIIIESDKNIIDKDDEFLELATELREIYPPGKKDGTTYQWRGTTAEVAKKLKTLVVKYKYSFTKEQVINATREYIKSFNGDYRRMRLLKYFILKSERDADDNVNIISELMSIIENEGQSNHRDDWTSEIV